MDSNQRDVFAEGMEKYINHLKIRLGAGAVGNQNLPGGAPTPPYTAGVTFWPGPVGFGQVGNASTNFISGIANPNLSWESVITYNGGIDFSLLNSRIEATVDIYKKITSQMLLFSTGPSLLGIGDAWNDLKAPIGNVGEMTNTGIDGTPNYTPHPAFYHLYYMRRFCGDVLLNSTTTGASGVVITPTAFGSGQIGAALVNTSRTFKIIRLNIRNFRFGDRFYTFTLTGTPGEEFSRKVYINGTGNALAAGGPDNYETIKAEARLITDEIRIMIPALSAVYLLAEPGSKELTINNEVSVNATRKYDEIAIYPNPSSGEFTLRNIPADISSIEIRNVNGESLYLKTDLRFTSHKINKDLKPGLYFIILRGRNYVATKKLVIW